MSEKVKTSIMVNREIWEEFRSRIAMRKGLKRLSQAIEEALEEEVSDILVAGTLEEMLKPLGNKIPKTVKPVKPKVPTDAGEAVRRLRYLRQ